VCTVLTLVVSAPPLLTAMQVGTTKEGSMFPAYPIFVYPVPLSRTMGREDMRVGKAVLRLQTLNLVDFFYFFYF